MVYTRDEKITKCYQALHDLDSDSLYYWFFELKEGNDGWYHYGYFMGLTPPIQYEIVEKNIDKVKDEDIDYLISTFDIICSLKEGEEHIMKLGDREEITYVK